MAYAKKRGNHWYVRWPLPERTPPTPAHPNGRPKEGYEDGFATRNAALKYGRDQEAAIRAGTWIDPKSGERTLADWWAEWFPVQRYRPNTRETYERRWIKQIEPQWGSTPLNAIRPLDMDKWINTLRETLSASTVIVVTAPLRDCLEDAVFNRMIQYSPMPPKDRRRQAVEGVKQKREGIVVPLHEAEAIMLRLRPAEALMVLIALFTGVRWSELAAMRRRYLTLHPAQDILPARGHYLIDPLEGAVHEDKHSRRFAGPPKSGGGRTMDLPPFLVALLLAYLATLPEEQDLLFPNGRGGWRQYDAWNRDRWRPACDGKPAAVYKNGRVREAVPPVHKGLWLHDFKHTHKAIMNNGRIHPVMQDYRLGHVQPGAPGVYSHPTPEMRGELVDWLESVWHSWNPQELIAWFGHWLGVDLTMQQSVTRNLLAAPRELTLAGNALF